MPQRLTGNRVPHRLGARAQQPSLLTGKLFDAPRKGQRQPDRRATTLNPSRFRASARNPVATHREMAPHPPGPTIRPPGSWRSHSLASADTHPQSLRGAAVETWSAGLTDLSANFTRESRAGSRAPTPSQSALYTHPPGDLHEGTLGELGRALSNHHPASLRRHVSAALATRAGAVPPSESREAIAAATVSTP